MQCTEYVPLAEVKDGEITDFQEGVCYNELWSISYLIKKPHKHYQKTSKIFFLISIVLGGLCFGASAQH